MMIGERGMMRVFGARPRAGGAEAHGLHTVAQGSWAAIAQLWSGSRLERFWNHKTWHKANQLLRKAQLQAQPRLCAIPHEPTRAEAERRREPFLRGFRHGYAAPIRIAAALVALASASPTPIAYGHGEGIEPGGGSKGPIRLSEAQQKAIRLQVVATDFRPLADLLNLNGEVQLLPGHQADVSTRISGQVQAVYSNLGDAVKVGQRLARVQSRVLGDPPPSVDIAAPMSGLVDAVNVAPGQSVEPSAVLFHVSDRSQVNVVARVYEEDLGKVQVGQQAKVRTLSYPDRVFAGKVILVAPTLEPLSRTVQVWISVANPEGLLKPNLFARASIVLKQNDAALSIPIAAILEANDEKFVFVREKGQYERVDIKTGVSDDDYAEVTDGLVPGDEVVTQGNRQVYTLWLTGGQMKAEE